jgi:hypothetical protein
MKDVGIHCCIEVLRERKCLKHKYRCIKVNTAYIYLKELKHFRGNIVHILSKALNT